MGHYIWHKISKKEYGESRRSVANVLVILLAPIVIYLGVFALAYCDKQA